MCETTNFYRNLMSSNKDRKRWELIEEIEELRSGDFDSLGVRSELQYRVLNFERFNGIVDDYYVEARLVKYSRKIRRLL